MQVDTPDENLGTSSPYPKRALISFVSPATLNELGSTNVKDSY